MVEGSMLLITVLKPKLSSIANGLRRNLPDPAVIANRRPETSITRSPEKVFV